MTQVQGEIETPPQLAAAAPPRRAELNFRVGEVYKQSLIGDPQTAKNFPLKGFLKRVWCMHAPVQCTRYGFSTKN